MPLPYFYTLNKAARALHPIVVSGVRRGLSGNSIYDLTRKTGAGIRRATLFDMVRRERAVQAAEADLRFVPLSKRPNPKRLPEALHKLRNRYSFKIRVTGIQARTGLSVVQNITISTNQLLSRFELQTLAETRIQTGEYQNMETIESSLLVGGLRAGVPGVL